VQREQDWLGQARAELTAARVLLDNGQWAWCCFTSQQAAEKALKALSERHRLPHLGHNLNDLLADVEARVTIPDKLRQACRALNRLYIPTRYPDAFERGVPAEQYGEQDAHEAVQDAEEVVAFAEGLIGPA